MKKEKKEKDIGGGQEGEEESEKQEGGGGGRVDEKEGKEKKKIFSLQFHYDSSQSEKEGEKARAEEADSVANAVWPNRVK